MRYGAKWLVAAGIVLAAAGVALAGGVTKTTLKNPSSFQWDKDTSTIGIAVGFSGPGAIAGATATGAAILPGSLEFTSDGSHTVQYTHSQTGHSHYRLLTAVVTGISVCYAKPLSIGSLPAGAMTCTNTLSCQATVTEDGNVEVAMTGNKTTMVTATPGAPSAKDFKVLAKVYATLASFTSEASLTVSVTSSSTVNAVPLSIGVANGQVAGYVFGF